MKKAPAARRYAVAGESMELFLRTGDSLYAGPGRARAGDTVLCMGKDAPLLAHRVLARWGLRERAPLLTKGDFHILPDAPASASAVVGRVRAVEREGERVWLDCGAARVAGAGLAAYSLAGALAYRLSQLAFWTARGLSLSLWGLAEASAGRELVAMRPELWTRWTRAQAALELAHLTLIRRALRRPAAAAFAVLARHSERRHGGELEAAASSKQETPVRWAAGEIDGDAVWSGEVRVFGDVVILPGASLTVAPGTKIVFLGGKRLRHGAARRQDGASRSLIDAKASVIAAYGRLAVSGTQDAPVSFSGAWGGLLLLGRGAAHEIRWARLEGARRGLLAADEARVELEGVEIVSPRHAGIELAGRASAVLIDCEVAGGREGLALSEASRAEASGCRFDGTATAVLARGGASVALVDCRVDGGSAPRSRGVRLEDRASCEASGGTVSACAAGFSLAGTAAAVLRGVKLSANGVALAAADASRLEAEAVAASASSEAALSLEGSAEAALEGCELVGGGAGARAGGRSRARLESCRVARFEAEGLAASDEAALAARRSVVEKNGSGASLADAARLTLVASKVVSNLGHGVWLKDAGAGTVEGGEISANKDNGIYMTGGARLELSGTELGRNGCGLSCEDDSSAAAAQCRFFANARANASFAGGGHSLTDCSLEGSLHGLSLAGRARARLANCRVEGAETAGAAAAGDSSLVASGCAFEKNAVGVDASGRARAALANCKAAFNRGHGIWLREAAAGELDGGECSRNKDNGLYLTGDAAARLSGGEFKGNRCALSGADRSRVRAEGTLFSSSTEANLSFTGGEHALKDCAVEGGAAGLSAAGNAALALDRCRIRGSVGEGLALAGDASATADASVFEKNETGIGLSGAARLRLAASKIAGSARHGLRLEADAEASAEGGEFAGNGEAGASLAGNARLSLSKSVLTGNALGLFADEDASASAADCLFEGNGTGIGLSGRARGEFSSPRVRSSAGHGLWLRDSSAGTVTAGEFSGNKANAVFATGRARLLLDRGIFERNGCGLSCEDESAVEASSARLVSNERANASLSGGEHSFSACAFEGSSKGLSAVGTASARLSDCKVTGSSGEGLFLAGEARVRSERGILAANGTGAAAGGGSLLALEETCVDSSRSHGLWLSGTATAEVLGGRFDTNADNGIYLTGKAELSLRAAELSRNRCGLSCEGEGASAVVGASFAENTDCGASLSSGSHRFEDCALSGSKTGMSAVGRARVALSGCSVSDCAGEGLSVAGQAEARAARCEFGRNGTGVGLCDEASASLDDSRAKNSAGHGLWLRDDSSAEVRGGELSANAENGAYLTGRSKLALSDAALEKNRCGLACAEDSASKASASRFASNSQANVSLTGGAHELNGCAVAGAPSGVVLSREAKAAVRGGGVRGNGEGLVLTGRARANLSGVALIGNATGVWAQEESSCRLEGGLLRGQTSQALRAGQSGALEGDGARFLRNKMAVLLEDGASAALSRCAFLLNPTGVKADGRSRLSLKGSRLRACRTDGAWAGAEARAAVENCEFTGNRLAIHYHVDARLELQDNEFSSNKCGDACCFSRCSCPPAMTEAEEERCLTA